MICSNNEHPVIAQEFIEVYGSATIKVEDTDSVITEFQELNVQ